MFNKRIMLILFIFVIAIGTISAVSAESSADDVLSNASQDEMGINDNGLSQEDVEITDDCAADVLSNPDDGSFNALQTKIYTAQSQPDAILELENDYYYHEGDGVPTITNDLTINGNGKTIDGRSVSGLLNILGNINVVLNNITFQNGNDDNIILIQDVNYVEMNDCVFTDNKGLYGGVAYIGDSVECSFLNCKFYDNIGKYGGTLDIVDVEDSSFIGCEFINNKALDDEGESHTGGALHIQDSAAYFEDCKFTNNSAAYGGAIYMINYGEASFIDCDFNNNSASASGGAIYLDGGNGVQVNNCNFYNNSAHYGGGILTNSTNNLKIDLSNFIDQSAHYGGAICLMNYNGVYITDCNFLSNSVFKMTDGSTAGAIYVEYGQKFQLKKSYFTGNLAVNAGAIYLGNAYDSIIESCNFTSNFGFYYGGAINFNNNVVKLQLISSSFTANYAFWGGALYFLTADDCKINSCYFTLNQAVSSDDTAGAGGAAYGIKCYGLEFNSCDFVQDYGKHMGGAIALTQSDNCNFNDCTFSECYAPNCGAAIVVEGTYNFNRCKFINNMADEYIGALCGGVATDCIFQGNTYPETYLTEIKNTPAPQSGNTNSGSGKSTNTNSGTVKLDTKIVASKKTFKLTAKTKKYTVTLKDSRGKVIKNARVTIKIKGKTYKAKTNAKGKAIFKLKLNKKGNFRATIKYSGSALYKAISKKVKLIVKK